jgi:hypothetical protein
MINILKKKVKNKIKTLVNQAVISDSQYMQRYDDLLTIIDKYINHAIVKAHYLDFDKISDEVLCFVESMEMPGSFNYRHAPSVPKSNIYGSVYACLLYFLLGKEYLFSAGELSSWGNYLNSFQNKEGLFVDEFIRNNLYDTASWWGTRHLSLHVIICLTYIGMKPKYEFNYIKKYYDNTELKKYLNTLDFEDIKTTDSDNAIMNFGCLLQYQRDFFNDVTAGETLETLVVELEKRINPKWGSWGYGSDDDMEYLSRAQQFAYHLYPIWFYDNRPVRYLEKLIDLTLKTQTILGGFGANLNSSACEDIDAIFILIKCTELTNYRKEDIHLALTKAIPWVLANQNQDSGFVFKRNEPFVYGHELLSSGKNESHLFATWFRMLSIAYLTNFFHIKSNFNIGRCPGMQF